VSLVVKELSVKQS